jgi:hypothetical protein
MMRSLSFWISVLRTSMMLRYANFDPPHQPQSCAHPVFGRVMMSLDASGLPLGVSR